MQKNTSLHHPHLSNCTRTYSFKTKRGGLERSAGGGKNRTRFKVSSTKSRHHLHSRARTRPCEAHQPIRRTWHRCQKSTHRWVCLPGGGRTSTVFFHTRAKTFTMGAGYIDIYIKMAIWIAQGAANAGTHDTAPAAWPANLVLRYMAARAANGHVCVCPA